MQIQALEQWKASEKNWLTNVTATTLTRFAHLQDFLIRIIRANEDIVNQYLKPGLLQAILDPHAISIDARRNAPFRSPLVSLQLVGATSEAPQVCCANSMVRDFSRSGKVKDEIKDIKCSDLHGLCPLVEVESAS